ncbi:MAG: hypothetical protein AAFZ05_11815 [Pseudomonadota bacterium]
MGREGTTAKVAHGLRDFTIAMASAIAFAVIMNFGATEPVALPILSLILPSESIGLLLDLPRQIVGQAVGPIPANIAAVPSWLESSLVTAVAMMFSALVALGLGLLRLVSRSG